MTSELPTSRPSPQSPPPPCDTCKGDGYIRTPFSFPIVGVFLCPQCHPEARPAWYRFLLRHRFPA